MIAETDDPLLLRQLVGIFASLRSGADWWDTISEAEKKKIEQGMREAAAKQTMPHEAVRTEVNQLLNLNRAAL